MTDDGAVVRADDDDGAAACANDGAAALSLAEALRVATGRLQAAGVPSPRADAELLAAHAAGLGLGELRARAITGAPMPAGFLELVDERAARVPLQHLTGHVDFAGVSLDVGPGVFIPRPETEQVALVARKAAQQAAAERGASPVLVDLCTGSGAIAAALAHWLPAAEVHAVELDPVAHAWARRNLAATSVRLVLGDATEALGDLDGRVDVVVSNPPYVPPGMVPRDPEVAQHDPGLALYGGGEDGLAVPRRIATRAGQLLREGGWFVMEHAESQDAAVRALLARTRAFAQIETLPDLAGRPRMVRARRALVSS